MFIKQNIYMYIILCHLTMYNIYKPVKLQKDDLLTLEETFQVLLCFMCLLTFKYKIKRKLLKVNVT